MRLYLTKREKRIDLFLKACVNFYGVLKHREFLNIINKQIVPKVKKQEVLNLWQKVLNAGEEKVFERGYIVYHNIIVADVATDELIETIEAEKRQLHEVELDLLMQYVDQDFYETNNETKELVNYIATTYNNDFAEYVAFSTVYASRSEKPIEKILEHIALFIDVEEKELNKLMDKIVAVCNASRKWALRGYTPNELYNKKLNNVVPFILPKSKK